MKPDSVEKWEYSEDLDGLLFFAQRCREMLFHYAIDNYKVPVLNTHLLMNEYCEISIFISKNVNEKRHLEKHLEIVLEEIIDTFKNDLVIKEYMRSDYDHFNSTIGSCSKFEKSKRIEYYKNVLDAHYLSWTIDKLSKLVAFPKKKTEIESLAKILLSELIANGYSSEYIYFRLKKVFFSDKVKNLQSFNSFVDYFSFEERSFDIHISVSKEIIELKEILEEKLDASLEEKEQRNVLVKFMGITELDTYRASQAALRRLNLLIEFYEYMYHRKRFIIKDKGFALDISENMPWHKIPIKLEHINIIKEVDEDLAKEMSKALIDMLIMSGHLELFNDAIILHNRAAFGNNFENGFLNLWSIMEMIIPNQQNRNRIESIIEKLIPVFRKVYVRKIFFELSKYLKEWDNDKYSFLINKVDYNGNELEKLIAFVLLPDFCELRKEFFSELEKYPLIRHRIFVLNDTFKTLRNINNIIDRHIRRIIWHLYRIYRTRNFIVHCGKSSKYIKVLSEHLHIYVDELILEMLTTIAEKPYLESIDAILFDILKTVEKFDMAKIDDMDINKDNLKKVLYRNLDA